MAEKTSLPLLDFQPVVHESMEEEVLRGLKSNPRTLPCKFLYDEKGSRLFDRICELEDYYLTRTEMAIMEQSIAEIAEVLGESVLLVELGSGSSLKTRILLENLKNPAGYVPIDISREHLLKSSEELAEAYPHVEVLPVCADYHQPFHLPERPGGSGRQVAYFSGSTIGNFHPDDAHEFLKRIRKLVGGNGGGLLIGVDLKKDPVVLHRAYNDSQGVTAEFNLNMLENINRQTKANFQPERFQHYAFYNQPLGRMEMHLVSLEEQLVQLNGATIPFRLGESIHTECSYKYLPEEFQQLASSAGFERRKLWMDEKKYFSVMYFEVTQN